MIYRFFASLQRLPFGKSLLIVLVGWGLMAYFIPHQSLGYPERPPLREPAKAPFAHSIAGNGIIEPLEESIAVAPQFSGRVVAVYVKEGDRVAEGQPLYKLDTQQLEVQAQGLAAQVAAAEAHEASLHAQRQKLQQEPRPETLPALKANEAALKATFQKESGTLARLQSLADSQAVAANELERQRLLVKEAQERWHQAQAQLALQAAGAWKPELTVLQRNEQEAAALRKQAQERLREIELQRTQSLVVAPKAGQILRVNIQVGESVQLMKFSSGEEAPLLMGNTSALQVRVDIDEILASDVRPNMEAMAFIKGNSRHRFPLTFERINPYLVPKKSLTGASAERNDVRVLQLIYRFTPPEDFTVWPGQQVEVYLKTTAPSLSLQAPASASTN